MPSIGAVVDEVNKTMAGFGFHEKMSLQGTVATLTITSPVPLTREQALAYQENAQQVFDEQLDFDVWMPDVDEWVMDVL